MFRSHPSGEKPPKRRRRLVRALLILLSLGVIAGILTLAVNLRVCDKTGNRILREPPSPGSYDAILVLGAGLRADGTPSDMLRDRLVTAGDLYTAGVAPRIILSGDRHDGYDEVGAMLTYLTEEMNLPAEAIGTDPVGYSTYESVANYASGEGGRVLIVTQEYHLYRALWIAQSLGVEASGAPADLHTYRGQFFREIREWIARVKDYTLTLFS